VGRDAFQPGQIGKELRLAHCQTDVHRWIDVNRMIDVLVDDFSDACSVVVKRCPFMRLYRPNESRTLFKSVARWAMNDLLFDAFIVQSEVPGLEIGGQCMYEMWVHLPYTQFQQAEGY
jgi:hypothetical protein